MADRVTIMRNRQLAAGREMQRRGISLKAVSCDSGIPPATVRSYFPGERDASPAVLPMSALDAFIETEALPLDIIQMLLSDKAALIYPPDGIDHEEMVEKVHAYLGDLHKARRHDSPAGPEICPVEEAPGLAAHVVGLRA